MKTLLLNLSLLFIPFYLPAQTNDTLQQKILEELIATRDSTIRASIGKPFAAFNATSLIGAHWSEQLLRGKVTMVNFWFRACRPCMEEMPVLNEIYTTVKENPNFQFISFTFDSEAIAKQVTDKYNISFTVLPVSKQECYQLNFNQGFPASMIIDKEGKIAFYTTGKLLDKDEIVRKIEQLLHNE